MGMLNAESHQAPAYNNKAKGGCTRKQADWTIRHCCAGEDGLLVGPVRYSAGTLGTRGELAV